MSGRVRELGESLHRRTMSALRIAFLSSMVLELLATLSVALVAVAIGMRLVYGDMSLYAGVVALVLAPEVYLPLRTVGERFHAAQDGMAAADKAFAILDPESHNRPDPARDPGRPVGQPMVTGETAGDSVRGRSGTYSAAAGRAVVPGCTSAAQGAAGHRSGAAVPEAQGKSTGFALGPPSATATGVIELRDLTVESRDGAAPDGVCAQLRPGLVTALTGPNGSGKSTVLQAILGLIEPTRGAVLMDGVDIREIPANQWWSRLAWLPQRPVLVPGTLRENLELLGATVSGSPRRSAARVRSELDAACAVTGFDAVLENLPAGWDTVVGSGGIGLSLGQRQRLALTRVLAANRSILLLDEPTAHLDRDSEALVAAALGTLARTGVTVVVVAHRPALLAAADEVVAVSTTTHRIVR